jgi:hypothetical protein
MPVDCAASDARSRGDFCERCLGHAMLSKYALGGVEQLLSRNGGLNLGLANHTYSLCSYPKTHGGFTNMHDCMYAYDVCATPH